MKKILLILLVFVTISCGTTENPKAIKGITPVDVYLNMEKQGFTTNKNLGSEYGNSWDNSLIGDNLILNVNTFSSDVNSVESVKATATVTPPKKIEASKQFLKFVSSLPYENSNPQQAAQWIDDNFQNDKASIIIGDAKFTIYCPTQFVRMLIIEKNKYCC